MLQTLLISAGPSEQNTIRTLLEKEEGNEAFELSIVETLAQALQILRSERGKWNVVIFDLDLPDAYGLPLIARVREEAPNCCLVMIGDDRSLAHISAAPSTSRQDMRMITHLRPGEFAVRKDELKEKGISALIRQGVSHRRSADGGSSAQNRYRSIVGELEVPLCRCDTELRILFANPPFAALFDTKFASLKGMVLDDVVKENIKQVFGFSSWKKLKDAPFVEAEWRRFQKDGNVQWLLWKTKLVHSIHDDTYDIQICGTDITTYKEKAMRMHRIESQLARAWGDAEQAREKMREQNSRMSALAERYAAEREKAEQALKMKTDFLTTMSHEIRTPMTGVIGMSELLQETALTEEQSQFVKVLRESGEVLLAIVNDILDLAKMEAGQLSIESLPCSPRELVDTIIRLLGPRAESRGLYLTCEIGEDVPQAIMSDPVRLQQILFNLVGNAIKFTERGGVRIVLCRYRENDSDTLRFEVIDTGIGIEKEALGRLFNRFSQADSSIGQRYGGTGLGLAICKQLVQLMDGDIGAESERGQGSVFRFVIPCRETKTVPSEKRDGTGMKTLQVTRSLRLLVAEDNRLNQFLIKTMLERLGHSIQLVGTGKQAVDAVLNESFDLVLMDVQMPEMDGVEATQAIRSLPGNVAGIPIIGVTADVTPEHVKRYKEAGMNECAVKPIQREQLLETINAVLDEPVHVAVCEMQSIMERESGDGEENISTVPSERKIAVHAFLKRVDTMIAAPRSAPQNAQKD